MHGITADDLQRVGPLVELPRVLRDFAVEPAPVLARAGLAADALDDPANMISFRAFGAVLAAGAEATLCPHFGLMVGQRSRPDHFGPIGELYRNAPTLGAAMLDLVSNQHRYIRGSVFHLLSGRGMNLFIYSVSSPGVTGLEQIVDAVMASCFVNFRRIAGMVPAGVRLMREMPANPDPYVALFGVRPKFNSPVTALEYFPRDLLAPLLAAKPNVRAEYEAIVEAYWRVKQPDMATNVLRAISARICSTDVGKAAIAAALGLHERTMSRRLLDEGTSFRELSHKAQLQVASQLLSGTSLTVARIAQALGYGDAAAFVKAFHHVMGVSPGEWRAQVQQQGDALLVPCD